MIHKVKKIRVLSLVVALAMLMSTFSIASAVEVPENVNDAKDKLATVDITQVYNQKEVDDATHNYATDGDDVSITYKASLQMTEEMATYLYYRQTQLMDAKFNVNINIDNLSVLEFDTEDELVTLQFASTFLKPADNAAYEGYSYTLAEVRVETDEEDETDTHDVFVYNITIPANLIEGKNSFTIPMELISCYEPGKDSILGTAYSYQGIKAAYPDDLADKQLMYKDFTVADWRYPISLSLGEFHVKEDVEVTYDPKTWVTIEASGTVDGEFSYIGEPATSIATLLAYENPPEAPEDTSYVTTLKFGNDEDITEWTSNKVSVELIRSVQPVIPVEPDSPYLNLEDHFAYIIGYPDGMVHPEGSITRAEVATIFFRMLKDEARNKYWNQNNPYSDVGPNDWYNNAISTLTNLGVIEGYPDGTFQPNGSITRAEFAAIAVRFFDGIENLVWSEDAFSDIENHWANEYINEAYLLGLISGYPDGTFQPQNAITRAEAMTIVNNTLRRSPVNEGLLPVEDMITWPDNANTDMWYYAAVQEATNSHEYDYFEGTGSEKWTEELPVRDWAAFEKAWSDANSASNPGEVVDSH